MPTGRLCSETTKFGRVKLSILTYTQSSQKRLQSVKLTNCQTHKMSSSQNVKLTKCQTRKMSSSQHVKLTKCHAHKMSDQNVYVNLSREKLITGLKGEINKLNEDYKKNC